MKDRMFQNTSLQEDMQSWSRAAEKIRETIHFASSFTTAIRCLKLNLEENKLSARGDKVLNENSKFLAGRLFKAPSILAPLYYFTLTFKREQLEGKEHITADYLMSLYTIDELAALLGLVYTYHRLRHVCDAEEWERYSKSVTESIEIAAHLGANLPEIGLANGMLLTGIRHLALAVFLKDSPKGFKNYRRDVKIQKRSFNSKMEFEVFGYTHIDVATQMLQALGYGVRFTEDFANSINTPPDKHLKKSANIMRILHYWTESLYLGTKPPEIKGEDDISVTDDIIDNLLAVSQRIRKTGSEHCWIAKGKSSISKKLVPQLHPLAVDDKPKALGRAKTRKSGTFSLETPEQETQIIEEFGMDVEGLKFIPYDQVPEHIRHYLSQEGYEGLTKEIAELV